MNSLFPQVNSIIKPYLKNFLYDSGPKNCIPKCPVDIKAWYHPHSVFQAYFIGNKDCSYKAQQILPFFVENFGPKWTEYTTMIHEFAGHHVEVSLSLDTLSTAHPITVSRTGYSTRQIASINLSFILHLLDFRKGYARQLMAETCLSFIKSILFFSMNHMWRQIDATCREKSWDSVATRVCFVWYNQGCEHSVKITKFGA